ncbi:MAG: pyruvate formate lyase-activating protein [Clostridia bacterium]|nr:pyruvate formate lyase-activating protein [Clostridia bacterium]
MKGFVHSFESLAAVDGKGVRFCVFLAGCPLRCVYCHNPDTWEKKGKEFSPEEIVSKLKRYKPYFGKEGGITFSGGEPLLQATFIRECVPLLQKEGIPYVIDTSGHVNLSEDVCYVLENAQQILLDLKFWDDTSYLKFTDVDMKKTIDLLSYLNDIKKETVLRTVIVPEINDNKECLSRYVKIARKYPCVTKHELLPFHTMGFFKYEQLGIKNPLERTKALDPEKLEELQKEFCI